MDNQVDKLKIVEAEEQQYAAIAASKAIIEIENELDAAKVNEVLPESVFKEYFLDFFLHPENYRESPLGYKWIELAGGPYNEVDIIDERGNFIFTAPSLCVAPALNSEGIHKYNFAEIAGNYNLQQKITSNSAANYLTVALAGVPELVATDVRKHVARLAMLHSRYGDDATAEPAVPAAAKQEAASIGIFDL